MTSDPKVATVDQDGNVKAVSPGKATITAVSVDMALKAYCEVTVQSGSVPVTGVDLDRSSASMVKGGSLALAATVKPANATDRSVSWSSSDTSVATVDQDGNVKAVSAGSATVTVTTRDGSKTAVCEISVKAESVPAKNIRLSQSSASLYEGGSIQLIATLTPSDSTDTVAWKSSNTGVATVDQDGNVKAVSAGTATISATSGGGYVTSSCMVTVKQGGKPVTDISLNADTLYLSVGGSSKLTATTYPSDASVRNVNWASDNAGVATVDQDGNVKAVAPGKAKITATSVDGGFEASCSVTVQSGDVQVTGITLDRSSLTLGEGGSHRLTATIVPSDASLKEVDWMTSDPKVATVDQDGNVKAVSPGKATITAVSVDMALKAYCEVTVENGSQGGSSSNLLLYAAAGIVGIVAILGAALFLRGRGS